jgi:predicted nucleic acid-binding protein
MSDMVVDSSVVAKWYLNELDSAQARGLLANALKAGDRLIVLDLVYVEVTNAIWKCHRQGSISADEARASLADLLAAPLHIEKARRLLNSALEIAMKYDRAVYDALFVALAIDLGLQGITADEPLVNVVGGDYPQIVLLRNWP